MVFSARQFTPSAKQWVEAGEPACVLSAFDRACNLVNAGGSVLALVSSHRGMTPFGISVQGDDLAPFRLVAARDAVQTQPGRLQIGRVAIDLSNANLWSPLPDWLAIRRAFSANGEIYGRLRAIALRIGKTGSLLDLHDASFADSPMASRIRLAAGKLAHGFAVGSPADALAGARVLAGLGGGLTPAGDDFIVGVFLAAWAGLFGSARESLCLPIANDVISSTTRLSAAYVLSAARGECTALWHQLLEATVASDIARMPLAVTNLLNVGHTSGGDALAGFLSLDLLN